MIKVTHGDTFGELGVRNVFIEYKGIQISLVGYYNHETAASNKTWTHMDQMKLYREGKDISEMHPNYFGKDMSIGGVEDLLDTIQLIDSGYFD